MDEVYKEIKMRVPGWKFPVEVKYAIVKMYNQPYMVWSINDINYTFKMPYKKLLEQDGSDYEEHFGRTLLMLKNDINEWYEDGFPEKWMLEYFELFKNSLEEYN